MISVLRQLPRNSRIISAVSAAAITASWITPSTAAWTNTDWSSAVWTSSSEGRPARMRGSSSFTRRTMSSVDALPYLRMVSSTARWPSRRTMLICGVKPSRTCATSFTKTVPAAVVRRGKSFISCTLCGLPFSATSCSRAPSLTVPVGRIRFCWLSPSTTSRGVRPLACSRAGSRSTMICRTLPP